jgi:DNA-binding response OmpR family regulator
MAPPRLLLVEDEFLIRLSLSEVLSDDGFEVVEAEDGDTALALLDAQEAFAIMLTDIQLPGSLDGRALAERARTTRPALPVIFMSGRPQSVASANPLDTYVNKPYLPSVLSATVRRILDGG